MSAKERHKGADGERELARLLSDSLNIEVSRNLEQVRQGGADLIFELPPGRAGFVPEGWRIVIEVKRYASHRRPSHNQLRKWFSYLCGQALYNRDICVLAHREDRREWRMVLVLKGCVAEISLADFVALMEGGHGAK